ncbi:hypothetical protein ES677_08400 [Bizionia gelidisalsuginis]|uniref:Carboxypeptidase-like regulatory domain-containing protein n=2 Tax=Bizionia TaxID=283785 RepID=A0A8H2LEN8_9FLAO|nr:MULTISPECIES: carboxypeptidase-like regulatory domain-containing protein [Bizionia]TYB78024.1 hypothetical protein ES676_02055 [Bizionia saleffrena]TYC12672.1 hypothetical protein ES677_08400 [Bizionia gelidisalsuginis]
MKTFIYVTKPFQMKRFLLFTAFLCCVTTFYAQEPERVQVLGNIYVDVDDLENVTIFNASTNTGVITNADGEFKISVGLNDEIQVSALQLKPFKTKITAAVIASKSLKIYLVEQINSLAEVILLPYDLTGNLETDVANVKLVTPIVFSFGSFENFDMPDDKYSAVENSAINQGQIRYQADAIAILGALVGLLFKNKKHDTSNFKDPRLETPISKWADAFPKSYYIENYNIPVHRVSDFISFLESQDGPEILLTDSNEFQRVAYLHKQSELFLKATGE